MVVGRAIEPCVFGVRQKYEPMRRVPVQFLEFLLAVIVLGYPLSKLPGNQSPHPPSFGPGTTTVELVGLSG